MRYEHTPRPEIESHYFIRELIENQEKKSDDRTYHRNKQKAIDDRNSEIASAPNFTVTDFYCEECQEDFKAQALKEIEKDWSCPTQNIAFYRTKHYCGKWCMRLITDKNKDKYWFTSKAVRNDRAKNYLDLLQPHETGFNTLYGKK